jgi:hypothetical protein
MTCDQAFTGNEVPGDVVILKPFEMKLGDGPREYPTGAIVSGLCHRCSEAGDSEQRIADASRRIPGFENMHWIKVSTKPVRS